MMRPSSGVTDNERRIYRRHRAFHLWAWFLLLFVALGCKTSPQEANSGYPSLVIRGNTPGQVLQAAETVMIDHGYTVRMQPGNRLVGEKPAGSWNNVAYGNWIGDSAVVQRVRLVAVSLGEAVVRLDAQTCLVRDVHQSTEEELPGTKYRTSSLEKLLQEVAAQFGPQTPSLDEKPN